MQFPTLTFGLFFLALIALTWMVRHNERRKLLLLGASWYFYGCASWHLLPLLMFSGLINWALAQVLVSVRSGRLRRAIFFTGVTANVAVLVFFKDYGVVAERLSTARTWLAWSPQLPLVALALPLGLSYYTFQAISYLADVEAGSLAPAPLLDVSLLMSFFPHLAAGPIVRASDLLPQLATRPTITREGVGRGLLLILWGLFKKIVIAAPLSADLVEPVFNSAAPHGAADTLAGVYGYAVLIFCDFSAYSDMAIGLAALLGYSFPPNFNQPYRAASFGEFWTRWHISLSSWLRQYVYFPLGGSRVPLGRTCFNLMVTMILGGLWHGPRLTFLLWGVLHGSLLCIEHLVKARGWPPIPRWLGVALTFHLVLFGWVLFGSDTLGGVAHLITGLTRLSARPELLTAYDAGLISLGLLVQFAPPDACSRASRAVARLPAPALAVGLACCVLVIDVERPSGVPTFLYEGF